MTNPHDPQPAAPEPPGGLTGEMELAWRQMARPDHTPGDRPMLLLAVQWAVLAKRLLDMAQADPGDLGRVNAAVTASTCLIRFSEKLGLSAADRKSLDITPPKAKPAGRPRTSLDDLHPEKLLSAHELPAYRERQAQMKAAAKGT